MATTISEVTASARLGRERNGLPCVRMTKMTRCAA